jgi:hypothetical protein
LTDGIIDSNTIPILFHGEHGQAASPPRAPA